jgi:mannose-1-phosphate guanylyltransferase
MRAILLAGGKGTRLRPLTLHTPKPIVPIFDRPFLQYQIDLLRQVPEIDEIVLSLNYQPKRIEEVFGDGSDMGIRLRYVVEPTPLGTGGAIRFAAGEHRGEPLVIFNGDVLTAVDLPAVIRLHRERQAKATIVLTPVDNPSAYGLVETDADGSIRAFLEKPSPDQIHCDTINAGIYVLEPETLERIPRDTVFSIERGYFPALVKDHETFIAYVYRGYWIDIGTPEKYQQAHRDIMDGRFVAPPFAANGTALAGATIVSPEARIDDGVTLEGPCFIAEGSVVKRGARIGPYSVLGHHCHVAEDAVVDGAILWPNTWVDTEARIGPALAGRHCHFGRNVEIAGGFFGDKSVVTDCSRA